MPYLVNAIKPCKGCQIDSMTSPFAEDDREGALSAADALSVRYPSSVITVWHVEDVVSTDGRLVYSVIRKGDDTHATLWWT